MNPGIHRDLVQSGKRWLTRSGIEREALAKRLNPTQALLLNGVILRVQQAVGDDIRHLAERIGIKAPGGECCGCLLYTSPSPRDPE